MAISRRLGLLAPVRCRVRAGWRGSYADGLHYERHHAGVPEINPDAHRLLIHRLVDRALICTIEIVQIVGLA
jgi:hypothetical protein